MKDDDRDDDAVSDPGAASLAERERAIREVCARIAAARRPEPAAQRAERNSLGERRRDPPTLGGATLRSPPAWVAPPAGAAPIPARVPVGDTPTPPPGHAPPASLPPVVQAPAFLKETAPLPETSPAAPARGGELPFRPAPPQTRAAARTVQSRVMGLGATTPADDDSFQRAVAAVTSPEGLPPLSLRQFASLCAELAFQPERRSGILERYGVRGEAVYTALDAYWRRERAARPAARTAFADDFATHLAWLHAHRA
jgi:hypothetical protein